MPKTFLALGAPLLVCGCGSATGLCAEYDCSTLTTADNRSTSAVAISAGNGFSCVLLADHTVRCWGESLNGVLGTEIEKFTNRPVQVVGLSGATGLSSGASHSCVTMIDSTVQCWGNNSVGELGDGTTITRNAPKPVSNFGNAQAVSSGIGKSCSVLKSGEVACWGLFSDLPSCTEAHQYSADAQVLPGLSNVQSVEAMGAYSCAVLADGSVDCWGSRRNVNGNITECEQPTQVENLSNAKAVSFVSNRFGCAVTLDGGLKCWDSPSAQAYDIAGFSDAKAISSALIGNNTCVLLGRGSIRCWGDNMEGVLGNGSTNYMPDALTPESATTVLGITNAIGVAAGFSHTCAVLSDGTARCWGDNSLGELGDGTTTSSSTPVLVAPW